MSVSRFPPLARFLMGASSTLAPTSRGLLRRHVSRFAASILLLSILHLLLLSSYPEEPSSKHAHRGRLLPGTFLQEQQAHQQGAGAEASGTDDSDCGTTSPGGTGSHGAGACSSVSNRSFGTRAALFTAWQNFLRHALPWPVPALLRRFAWSRDGVRDSARNTDQERGRVYKGYAYVVPVRRALAEWEERRGERKRFWLWHTSGASVRGPERQGMRRVGTTLGPQVSLHRVSLCRVALYRVFQGGVR